MKLFLLILTAATCFAQNDDQPKPPEPSKYYRLDFVVKETDAGRAVNSRNYVMTIKADTGGVAGSIRIGDRVPVSNGKDQFTFIDVGVNIDCTSPRLVRNQLVMQVLADISSVASERPPSAPPMINQTKSKSEVTLPMGKAVTVFSADGASTKRQMQLEVTATPIP